jgi:hypothetical protein
MRAPWFICEVKLHFYNIPCGSRLLKARSRAANDVDLPCEMKRNETIANIFGFRDNGVMTSIHIFAYENQGLGGPIPMY